MLAIRAHRRGRIEVMAAMLSAARTPIGFTRLINKVGITCVTASKLLDHLKRYGLIIYTPNPEAGSIPKGSYHTTPDGIQILRALSRLGVEA